MKTYIFLLIGVLALGSCSKTDDFSLLKGEWTETNTSFLITLNEEFNFVEIYTKPWKGEIKINNVNIEIGDFYHYVRYPTISGNNVRFHFENNSLWIYYEGEYYIFDNTYIIDMEKGKFIANGIAKSINNQISIEVNLYAQSTYIHRDIEYEVNNNFEVNRYPYFDPISFQNNKSMQGTSTSDPRVPFWGTWRIDSNKLILNYTSTPHEEVYSYSLTNDDTLILYEDIDYNVHGIYSYIPKTIIKDIKYQHVLSREY